jgi:hypothetical protein
MSNLKMTFEGVFCSFVWLEAHKMWSCALSSIERREKIFDQNLFCNECVENLVH